jgi:glycosyltransferase involved in cell wall biosynthesis
MWTMRIRYFVDNYAACAWYRCHVPGLALKERGHDVVMEHRLGVKDLEACDVLVLQRQFRPNLLRAAELARESGKLVVSEVDDDLWSLEPHNPAYRSWSNPRVIQGLEAVLRASDMVTTTTHELRRRLLALNEKVEVLPNMLPDMWWPPPEDVGPENRSDSDGRLVIGWAGSATHAEDLRLLSGVIEQILERHSHVEFRFAGMDSVPFDAHPRISPMPPVKLEGYPGLLRAFDIGIAPLTGSRFNRAKSDLKFLEYAAAGVASVVSRVPAYERSVEHGESGFLARNAKDWLKHLNRLIVDEDLRKGIGRSARAWAETRMIDRNVHLWEQAYSSRA